MKVRLYSEIARKYGMTTFIPCTDVDGTTPQSETILDYGLSTTQTQYGGTFAPSFNTVGNGDWIDTSAATTSQLVTSATALLPGTSSGFILAFGIKSASHPNYTDGEFSVGNPASGAVIQYASTAVGAGTVTIKDFLAASLASITTTESTGSGIKGVLIHCGNRATADITVWSGRVSGISGTTGSGTLSTPAGNIITSNYYMQDIDELHSIFAWQYPAGETPPTPTDSEVSDFFNGIYNSSRFGRQVRDWDAIPTTWTNEAVRDAMESGIN